MGRCFFVIGSYLTNSIFSWFSHDPTSGNGKVSIPSVPHGDGPRQLPRTLRAEQDRVVTLPGLTYDPGFEHFAGYLTVGDREGPGRHIFYWYVESAANPADDPVILWTNGGPGCSGLLGLGTEHGPFYAGPMALLHPNPYSWNKLASVLYVEIPAGVGFSFTDLEEDEDTNDALTAIDNYHLLLEFYERFPERRRNDFYIASESYGGHYVPQLALEILRHDNKGGGGSANDHAINFRGFLVGNPYVDPFTNLVTQIESYYSHGLLAKPLYDRWSHQCKNRAHIDSPRCGDLMMDLFREFGRGINPYALDYPVCHEKYKFESDRIQTQHQHGEHRDGSDQSWGQKQLRPQSHQQRNAALVQIRTRGSSHSTQSDGDEDEQFPGGFRTSSSQVNALMNRTFVDNNPPFLPKEDEYRPCSETYWEQYLNRPEVRKALHVDETARPASTYPWGPCGGVSYSRADVDISVVALYREIVERGVEGSHRLRMLVFSGDDDSVCSTAGTQEWVWTLGVEPDKLWKAWQVNGQTAGFVSTFRLGPKERTGGFDGNDYTHDDFGRDDGPFRTDAGGATATLAFATVHGAGHEVPAYRPMEALSMLEQFLNGTW
jgi:Serine carboxypeptidase